MAQFLFTINGFSLRSYGVIVALAIILGTGVAYVLASEEKEYRDYLLDLLVYAVIGSIIGARLWQVFFYEWDYYSVHPSEILKIWHGGLAVQGSLVGAFLVGGLYTRLKKIDFWRLADIATPGLILGQGIGRIACFLNGDAYGTPTNSGFGLVYPPGTPAFDVYGNQPLWPAEIWEGQWDIIVFVIILILLRWRKWTKGTLFLTYIILYSLGRFALEFLRGDVTSHFLSLSSGQWGTIGGIVLALVCLGTLRLRRKI
ncbi:prolipoprotein diacylglyceryl transferase [Desulfitobacterium sp. AusDCA]|uniref:prolipoprotein diacylglyceryl transferase n=1 Tax=Desulfitobacterium sp. AusDCA TaxID=3240383 RepID=UPI003DA71B09